MSMPLRLIIPFLYFDAVLPKQAVSFVQVVLLRNTDRQVPATLHMADTYSPGLYGGKHGEERTARSTGSPQGGRGDHDRPRRLSGHPVTQPYQRWLGATPSSRYAILIRLR